MSNLDQTRYFTVELQQHDVRSPALILIGTVVSLHELLQRLSGWHDANLTSRKPRSRHRP